MADVLITGVAGFIGSKVAARLLDDGHHVIGVDDFSSGKAENIPYGVEFIRGDLAEDSTIRKIPQGCEKILHLAGQSSGEISFDDPVADLKKNTISTLNLIRYGIENKVDRFVYASSMAVYGPVRDQPICEDHTCLPLSCYAISKLASENYLTVYGNLLPFVILRMFNVYGPGQEMANLRQGMVSIYLAQALHDGRIRVKGGVDRFRDFIYIDDVVEVWNQATFADSMSAEIVNVGTGRKTSVEALLRLICDLVPESTYFIDESTKGDQLGIYADTSKLRKYVDTTKFTALEIGVRKFSKWAKTVVG